MTQSPPQDDVISVQIGLLRDVQDQTLQSRFEEFCREIADRLMECGPNGDPVFPAGSAKGKFSVTITCERTADDAFNFRFEHEITKKMPSVPGKARSSVFHRTKGLVQRVGAREQEQLPLLNPAEGQPNTYTDDDVRRTLPKE